MCTAFGYCRVLGLIDVRADYTMLFVAGGKLSNVCLFVCLSVYTCSGDFCFTDVLGGSRSRDVNVRAFLFARSYAVFVMLTRNVERFESWKRSCAEYARHISLTEMCLAQKDSFVVVSQSYEEALPP